MHIYPDSFPLNQLIINYNYVFLPPATSAYIYEDKEMLSQSECGHQIVPFGWLFTPGAAHSLAHLLTGTWGGFALVTGSWEYVSRFLL